MVFKEPCGFLPDLFPGILAVGLDKAEYLLLEFGIGVHLRKTIDDVGFRHILAFRRNLALV